MNNPQKPEGTAGHSVYEEVAKFTMAYFGDEAPQYVAKLIEIHTHKPPAQLSKAELISLIDWIKNAVSFLAEDKNIVEKYIAELFKLAGSSPKNQPYDKEVD